MPLKVLVVDDEERILQICEYFLRGEGFEVFSTRDAKQALEIAARERPDLVVSDVVMPSMGGYQFAKELRLAEALRATPVLFLSAKVEIPDLFFEHFKGPGDFLIKPFKKQDLLEKVRDLLSRGSVPEANEGGKEKP